jgi:hemerythrin-like metal-binding protein
MSVRLMRWLDLYSTGIEKVDRQHENLTDLLNCLNEAWRTGKGHDVLLFRVDQLLAGVGDHFRDEEQIMIEREYPDLDLHKAEHDFLLAQVLQFRTRFAANEEDLTETMLDFLRDWLRDHILISDRRLGRFVTGEPKPR